MPRQTGRPDEGTEGLSSSPRPSNQIDVREKADNKATYND